MLTPLGRISQSPEDNAVGELCAQHLKRALRDSSLRPEDMATQPLHKFQSVVQAGPAHRRAHLRNSCTTKLETESGSRVIRRRTRAPWISAQTSAGCASRKRFAMSASLLPVRRMRRTSSQRSSRDEGAPPGGEQEVVCEAGSGTTLEARVLPRRRER